MFILLAILLFIIVFGMIIAACVACASEEGGQIVLYIAVFGAMGFGIWIQCGGCLM